MFGGIFMTGLTVLRFILETLAVLAIGYGFYREDAVVKFERKVFRFFKRAVKIIISEIRKSRETKRQSKVNNIVEFSSKEDIETQYEFLLKNVG